MPANPEEFKPLRLRGGRFDQPTGEVGFPLEAIGELARYERLVIQVARGLWHDEHPDRKRAPRRFEDSLRLRLTDVAEGSVMPVLQRRQNLASQLFDPDQWLGKSQDMIGDTVAAVAAGSGLPDLFPESATPSLVQFGSGLRENEEFVLRDSAGRDVVYNQTARRHLVLLTSPDDVEVTDELVGRLSGFQANEQTFDFSDRSGRKVRGNFTRRGLIKPIRDVTDRTTDAPFVRLSCTYSEDGEGDVDVIRDVEEVDVVVGPDDYLAAPLRKLLELNDGWHNGNGRGPAVSAVEWARDFVAEFAEREPELHLFPTLEGGVLIEHQLGDDRWSLEVDPETDVFVAVVRGTQAEAIEPSDLSEAVQSLERYLG